MGLHAFGTAGVLFSESRAGFQIAIPVGLLVSAFFAAGSAFVDARPELGPRVMRQRAEAPRQRCWSSMAVWFLWTLADLPPLRGPNSEAATGTRARGTGDPRNDRLRGERRPLLAALPAPPHAALDGRDRVLPAARRRR